MTGSTDAGMPKPLGYAPVGAKKKPARGVRSFRMAEDEAADLQKIMDAAGTDNPSAAIRSAIRVAAAYADSRDEAWTKSAYREGFIAGMAEFKCQIEAATRNTMDKLKAHKA